MESNTAPQGSLGKKIALTVAAVLFLCALFFLSLWAGLRYDLPFYAGTPVMALPQDNAHLPTLPSPGTAQNSGVTAPADSTVEPPVTEPTRPVYPVTDRPLVICIDPGHGYDDPGTVSPYFPGRYEKEINLKVSLLVAEHLREAGFAVILTREDDVIPPSHDPSSGFYLFNPFAREEFVESQEVVDLFVSIHCNSMPDGTKEEFTGTELYYCIENNTLTPDYAQALAAGILSHTDRQCKIFPLTYENAFYVTKAFPVPAVLVEMGYLSSQSDADLLFDDAFLANMANGIADGIVQYARDTMLG